MNTKRVPMMVLFMLAATAIGSFAAVLVSVSFSGSAVFQATYGLALFKDAALSQPLTTYDLGPVGRSKTYDLTVYIKNNSDDVVKLQWNGTILVAGAPATTTTWKLFYGGNEIQKDTTINGLSVPVGGSCEVIMRLTTGPSAVWGSPVAMTTNIIAVDA